MKNVFATLSCIIVLGFTSVFANDRIGINRSVKESFSKEFPGVDSVKWEKSGEYLVATFMFEHRGIKAFFNEDGEWLGHASNVLFDGLPLAVSASVAKYYPSVAVYAIIEAVNPAGTFYWMTIEKGERKYRVKINVNGSIIQKKLIPEVCDEK